MHGPAFYRRAAMSGRHGHRHGPGRLGTPRRLRRHARLGRGTAAAHAPRRRPGRVAGPARGGAADRLRPDGGDRAPLGGRRASEPRLGVPHAQAARGRGAGPRRGRDGPHAVHAHRRRQGLRRGEPREARRALGQARRGRRRGPVRSCAGCSPRSWPPPTSSSLPTRRRSSGPRSCSRRRGAAYTGSWPTTTPPTSRRTRGRFHDPTGLSNVNGALARSGCEAARRPRVSSRPAPGPSRRHSSRRLAAARSRLLPSRR